MFSFQNVMFQIKTDMQKSNGKLQCLLDKNNFLARRCLWLCARLKWGGQNVLLMTQWTTALPSTASHLAVLSAYVEPSDAQITKNGVAEIIIVLHAESYQEHLQGPRDLPRELSAMEAELLTDAGGTLMPAAWACGCSRMKTVFFSIQGTTASLPNTDSIS